VNGSAGSARLTGDLCSPNTVHWTFDNYALANGTGRAIVSTGGTRGSSSRPTMLLAMILRPRLRQS
jgi:hypothetical protein